MSLKSFLAALITSVGVALIVAGGVARAREAEWTVMVFLNAKNNLAPYAITNYQQMQSVGSTDDVNIVVEYGRLCGPSAGSGSRWCGTL